LAISPTCFTAGTTRSYSTVASDSGPLGPEAAGPVRTSTSGPGPELEHCAAPTLRKQLDGLDDRIAALQRARSALAELLLATAAPGEAPG